MCQKICTGKYKGANLNSINTLRPRQNGRHFADDIFKCIFSNENISNSINISLKFVPQGRINNIPALVQIMAWRRLGDKPLSEPMMVSLLTHICVTRSQWVNRNYPILISFFNLHCTFGFQKHVLKRIVTAANVPKTTGNSVMSVRRASLSMQRHSSATVSHGHSPEHMT